MKKLLWILIGLLLISLVMPVMAASDIVGTSGSVNSSVWDNTATGHWPLSGNITGLVFHDVESFSGLYSVIMTGISAHNGVVTGITSGSTVVSLYAGNTNVGAGVFYYNNLSGVYTITFQATSFTPTGLTGDCIINFTTLSGISSWSLNGLYGYTTNKALVAEHDFVSFKEDLHNDPSYPTTINDYISSFGGYRTNVRSTFFNAYDTADGGIGITNVIVSKNVSGISYASKVYITSPSYLGGFSPIVYEGAYTITHYSGTFFYTPIKISIFDKFGRWWNSSLISGATALGYGILLSPSNITTTTPSTAYINSTSDPLLYAVTDIAWKWSDDTGYYNFFESGNTSRPLDYTLKSGTWYGYEVGAGGLGGSYSLNKGASVPNPVSLSGITTTGNKTITCYVGTSDGSYYTLTSHLNVGAVTAGGTVTTNGVMIDWLTGNRIYYGTISFKNLATSTWINQSPTTGGIVHVSSNPTVRWNIYGSASGYTDASLLGQPALDGGTYTLFMYPLANLTYTGGLTALYVTVEDTDTLAGISGATIYISNVVTLAHQTAYTASNGVATLNVNNNSQYWASVSAAGYTGATGSVTIVAEPMYSYHISLSRTVPTAIPTTYTPVPTATTPIPGYTPAPGGGIGNFTGFWAPFQNAAVAMGATPDSVGLLMAMVLAFAGLVVGFMVGSIPGGEMGAILGVMASVAFGFFPLALAIVVTVGLIGYVSLRFWGMTH